jgi:hypothetical protein
VLSFICRTTLAAKKRVGITLCVGTCMVCLSTKFHNCGSNFSFGMKMKLIAKYKFPVVHIIILHRTKENFLDNNILFFETTKELGLCYQGIR